MILDKDLSDRAMINWVMLYLFLGILYPPVLVLQEARQVCRVP